ncbi:MAG: RidA family protein [Candidatus Latescibacteria bacterium]|nr:RidA family protein [Candidatus Latescibacterota bacterium]
MSTANPRGNYFFLKGIAPYSSGVVAAPDHEIVHLTFRQPLPWRQGFAAVSAHLESVGRPRHALCAMELRAPSPFTMEGFIAFNREYCQVLDEWGLFVDGLNPIARTNVAPLHNPPASPALHAFSYTIPSPAAPLTLVVAGAGELRGAALVAEGIIRRGCTDAQAMEEKAAYVLEVMEERLLGLGGNWDLVHTADVYTVHPLGSIAAQIWDKLGPAARHGFRWHQTRPPVVDIEFEMDLRGTRTELYR